MDQHFSVSVSICFLIWGRVHDQCRFLPSSVLPFRSFVLINITFCCGNKNFWCIFIKICNVLKFCLLLCIKGYFVGHWVCSFSFISVIDVISVSFPLLLMIVGVTILLSALSWISIVLVHLFLEYIFSIFILYFIVNNSVIASPIIHTEYTVTS